MSAGAVRHYFPTQAALLAHALDLVKQRVTARIVAIQNRAYLPREMVIRLLLELIPLDPDTSLEMQVWFGYIYSGYFADGFPDGPKDELRQGMSRVFRLLDHYGLLRPDLDVSLESEVLYALVDGLALHAMLEPARIGREQAARVLNRYLDTICLPET